MAKKGSNRGRRPEITVFFPAFNEADNLKVLIPQTDRILKGLARKYEIMVVNYEGTSDDTERVVKRLSQTIPTRIVYQPLKDKGVGEGIRLGFLAAKYEHVFYTDADNQFDIEELKDFIPLLGKFDVIAGYRKKRNDPVMRSVVSNIYNMLIRIVFGLGYRDVDCAFRYVNKKVIDRIDLKARTGVATSELLYKAKKAGFRITQIPVTHKPRLHGQSVFVSGMNLPSFKTVKDLIREIRDVKSAG